MNILHVDTNHPLLIEQLEALGHHNVVDISSSKTEIAAVISEYDGLIGIGDYSRCSMKFNNEGSKLISFSPYDFAYKIGGIQFFDFNNTTGLILRKRNITKT